MKAEFFNKHTTKLFLKGVIIFAFFLSLFFIFKFSVNAAHKPSYKNDEIIVAFKAGISEQQQNQTGQNFGDTVVKNLKQINALVIKLRSGRSVSKAIQDYRGENSVRYAEPNYIVNTTGVPNDTYYSQLWGLKNTGQLINGISGISGADIKAEPAWSITTGSSNVVVGVVDTGLDYTHPDLSPNVWNNPGGIGGCPAGTHGFNAIDLSCSPMDDNYHGTHVSGTIGAVGNNASGVVGVNWKSSIMGLKFLDADGSGYISDAISAIDFAIQAKIAGVNIRVLNNSWGGGGYSQALLDEINKAGQYGILFVVAAGNSSLNLNTNAFYPCSYKTSNMICVAATDQNDSLAWFSNYGSNVVDLAAPGTNILSTIPGGYAFLDGTSMATPHVVGEAALILSAPGKNNLTAAQLKSAILQSVDSLSALTGIIVTNGRIDVCKAIPGCSLLPVPTLTPTISPIPTPIFTPIPTPIFTPTPTPPIPSCINGDGEC